MPDFRSRGDSEAALPLGRGRVEAAGAEVFRDHGPAAHGVHSLGKSSPGEPEMPGRELPRAHILCAEPADVLHLQATRTATRELSSALLPASRELQSRGRHGHPGTRFLTLGWSFFIVVVFLLRFSNSPNL